MRPEASPCGICRSHEGHRATLGGGAGVRAGRGARLGAKGSDSGPRPSGTVTAAGCWCRRFCVVHGPRHTDPPDTRKHTRTHTQTAERARWRTSTRTRVQGTRRPRGWPRPPFPDAAPCLGLFAMASMSTSAPGPRALAARRRHHPAPGRLTPAARTRRSGPRCTACNSSPSGDRAGTRRGG